MPGKPSNRRPSPTASLTTQQAYWYAKLKQDGFEDIEDTSNPLQPLKEWHNLKWSRPSGPSSLQVSTTIEYYTRARHAIASHAFDHPLHLKVWELHCDGLSVRAISKAVKGKLSKSAVAYLIKRLAEEII